MLLVPLPRSQDSQNVPLVNKVFGAALFLCQILQLRLIAQQDSTVLLTHQLLTLKLSHITESFALPVLIKQVRL